MERDDVIKTLQANQADLEGMGVRHAGVAGSYARSTQIRPFSDIDIVAQFDKARLSLVKLGAIRERLERMFDGPRVDLLDIETLPDRVRQRIEAEAVFAF